MLGVLLLAAPLRKLQAKILVPFTRTWTQHYPVSGPAHLNLDTKYGHVTLHAWNNSTIQVQVTITGYGHDAGEAQDLANQVTIKPSFSGNTLKLRTAYEQPRGSFWKSFFSWGTNGSSGKDYVKIDYDIYVPENLASFQLSSNYVDAFLASLDASIQCDMNYGSLTSQDQQGPVSISCNYTHLQLARVQHLNLHDTYSTLLADHLEEASVHAEYGHTKIQSAGKLDFHGDYGSLELGRIDQLTLGCNYTDVRLEHLTQEADIKTTYAHVQLGLLDSHVKLLHLDGVYSTYFGEIPASMSIQWKVSCTYGHFSSDTRIHFTQQDRQEQGRILNLTASSGDGGGTPADFRLNGTYTDFNIVAQHP